MPIPEIDLGWFAEGAIPPNIVHTYVDYDGEIVDLTGYSSYMQIEAFPPVQNPLGIGAIQIVAPATNGQVEYSWHENDMLQASSYQAQMWVTNGTKRYESDVFKYIVYDGPGTYPSL